jgi:hypothetical protein
VKVVNEFFENVSKLKYLGVAVMGKADVPEVKRIFNLGNAFYY